MNTTTSAELKSFHDFIGQRIGNGDAGLSPEEALDIWRAEHPTADEISKSVAAINEVIADVEGGDCGRDAVEILNELRKKHGITS